MVTTKTYTLQHEDGTEVTAQEVYDAYMSGRVIINGSGFATDVVGIEWTDADGAATDPTAIVYAKVIAGNGEYIEIGTDPNAK